MALAVWSPAKWRSRRVSLVRRMLVLAHARHLSPQGCSALADQEPKEFAVYKPYLLYLAMVDGLYTIMFKAGGTGYPVIPKVPHVPTNPSIAID